MSAHRYVARLAPTLLLIASLIGLSAGPAAAERRALITEGADYYGRDIGTLKEVPLEDCESACVADPECKAFTYNTKARWCFKKADFGDLRPFPGAISGRIVEGPVAGPDLEAQRARELGFLPSGWSKDAPSLLAEIQLLSVDGTLEQAIARASRFALGGDLFAANAAYKSALRLAPERFDLWESFTSVSLAANHDAWSERNRLVTEATRGAILAYLRAVTDDERARALDLLSTAYAKQEFWKPAIKTMRARVAVASDAVATETLDRLIREHGFRVTGNRVETEAETPRICVTLSEPIASDLPNITDFVTVTGGDRLAVEAESGQVCAAGVEYGNRYAMTLRQGLPAADGEEALHKSVTTEFYIRDRDASVRFVGRGYVLPKHDEASIPVVSVNVDTIEARVVRVGDRNVVSVLDGYTFLRGMGSWQAEEIAGRTGEAIWEGTVTVARETNREVTTAIHVGDIVKTLEPGVYALVARGRNEADDWGDRATQWFLVSDMGLRAMTGNDGLHAVLRSLGTAGPIEGATVTLVARNNEVLGASTTDADGYARFDAGLLRGSGGNAPALMTAATDGDYAFIDLTAPAFDLTDRGVSGRPAPLPVDVFATTERGVYRPGEWVHVTALMRDAAAVAAPDLPMTLVVHRPDGVEHLRQLAPDEGSGGRTVDFQLPGGAMRGSWRAQVFTDPEGASLAETTFLVEDFLPERIDFSFDPGDEPLPAGGFRDVTITADWLYGAPAANLGIEGEVYVTKADGIPSAPTYRFGLESEEFYPVAEPVTADPTGEDGAALVTLNVPDVSNSTVPLQAAIHIRVLDTNGRPVERRRSLPVVDERPRLGVDPEFDDSVGEGEDAAFEVALFDGAGARIEGGGFTWTLSRINTRYQWYKSDGSWDYQPIRTDTRVASGEVDIAADSPTAISAPVEWGEYRLDVRDPEGAAIPVSMSFYAGWYVPPSADPAPDMLEVSLDKPKYRVGETLTARILPRFPGVAVVSVIDDRLIDMKVVEVGEDGATVSLPVTSDWGPGAYVTAELLRPLDLPAKRMPQRAIGLAWAGVDPGDRLLSVDVGAPAEIRPQGPLDIEVTLANAKPGDAAFVTIAAVDLGILNITSFEPPAPEDWYFARRRLGMEIRDVYGRLIDTTLGARGEVRSGGDGAGIAKLLGPPPTETLVAFFQGVTEVGPDGKARASFDIPDFNGTIRVMAVAWSKTAVGHGHADVLVREPVVIQASLPNFLAPGDTSRLRLDLTHLTGPSGDFRLSVDAAGSLVRVGPGFADRVVGIADKGSASVIVPLEAQGVGDETLTVSLAIPGGEVLTRTLTMPVRANEPPVVRLSEVTLAANTGRLTVGPDMLSDFVPGTGVATVTVGGVGGIDLPGLVHSLDKYPYGCAEQITSRALPLVYLDEVIVAAGLTGGEPVRERVQTAIADVLVNQASNGGFGLWRPDGEGELWLNAYITDFLTRAREKGYDVPTVAFDLAVTNLKNRIAYAQDFTSGGEEIAYALYVLARNGRASIGDLRYFAETKLDAFTTPLGKAQLGAALALYGEKAGADTVFRAALGALNERADARGWRADYGSDLRDGAAILTLASETRTSSVDLDLLSQTIRSLSRTDNWHSTQEQAWMLLAAHSLLTDSRKPLLDVNGSSVEGVLTARYDLGDLTARPVVIANRAGFDTDARVTLSGAPITPEPASGRGYTIDRRAYDLDGVEIDPSRVPLGQRMVVVLTVSVEPEARRWARLMVDDPLPAGLAIDNPNLLTSADVANLPWLDLLSNTASTEFRADRFLTAIDYRSDATAFSVGYMARAVAPGTFAYPSAVVEDMYRPYMRARTGSGSFVVDGPLR
ncbi:MAG TPA: alpha-2-macroglobulin family protein [Methylomirabilota bacterium]|nr:alpha-2-macroglobulin family protein [Methylomirabilota bacterium]